MQTIYNYNDYKEFLNDWVQNRPRAGHGEYRRMALHLGISTTMISQVFKAEKHLSLEMACELGEYLELSEEESEYFLLLVEYNRAGSHKLSKTLLNQIKKRQERARKLENRIKKDIVLDQETKAIYYSSWMYGGVRMLAALKEYNTAEEIAERLKVPRKMVQQILEFMVAHSMINIKNGKLEVGPTKTHLPSTDPLVSRHHQNWRLQGFQKMQMQNEDDFFLTAPIALSKEVADKIRQELPDFITKIQNMVTPSKSEVIRCLNIDWFEY